MSHRTTAHNIYVSYVNILCIHATINQFGSSLLRKVDVAFENGWYTCSWAAVDSAST